MLSITVARKIKEWAKIKKASAGDAGKYSKIKIGYTGEVWMLLKLLQTYLF